MSDTMEPNQTRRRLYQMPDSAFDTGTSEVIDAEWLPPEHESPGDRALADASKRRDEAMQLVARHAALSTVAGLVPVPVVDNLVIGSLHLQMVRELTLCYGLPFSARRTAIVVSVLLWGMGIPSVARWTGRKLFYGIPFVGKLMGWAGGAAMNGAITYAVGKVLVYHFATGGNLFNFDAEKARSYFVSTYKEALSNPVW